VTHTPRRTPYGTAELEPLYNPRSIAIVGASPRAGSFGARTLENLEGFDGAVYPVNEKYQDINGTPCYASIAALPEVPDLVVLTTPAGSIEALLEDCIAVGVPSVMIYASGFSEVATADGIATQKRIAARAAEAGIRVLGPNCVGLLNYTSGARITFAGTPEGRLETGPAIGLICQSGALGFALAQAMERGVGFSHVVSCGNSSDVDVADWVSALAGDPTCTAIACAFEGLADPQKFLRAAEIAWAANKPLIVLKMAVSEEGAAAAMSHTASLAGSSALWNALLEKGGAITVEDFDALIETAWFFAKAPEPQANGVAMLSGSGGAAIMSSDFAEIADVPMPQPGPKVVTQLKALIPPFVPARNPCDVTAGVINDVDTLLSCADALLGDANFGSLIFGYTYAYDTATQRLPHLSALAAKHGKPIIYVWLTQLLEGPGTIQAESDPNVMVFRSMRRAFVTIKAWTDRAERRKSEAGQVATIPVTDADTRARVAAILSAEQGSTMGEAAAKTILANYGIMVPREERVKDRETAITVANTFGTPLALKIDSPDILHKSDAGGVVLNVTSGASAGDAFDQIMTDCTAAYPDAQIDGVLLQEMVPPGLEIIAGFRNVEGFGPVLTVGMGGVLTEILQDTVSSLAPVSADEAVAMLQRLRGARLLDGFRGAKPIPLATLAQAVAALSRIAVDFSSELAEFDVNPLICLPDRIIAVDGLAVLSKPPQDL
jgi:acetate---CoA ligase (ADP-forming)